MISEKGLEDFRSRFESVKPSNAHRPRADDMESVWASYNAAQVEAEQRRMIKAGIAVALSILLGIGLGVVLERSWTAMNAEVIEVAK